MDIPNCVPEYYRELQEREEREYEKEYQLNQYYEASKQKLRWALRLGWPVLDFGGYSKCAECRYKISVQTSAEDDLDTIICCDRGCVCHIRKE